ncbi:MAG: Crp/Fnr family transcriptional regulator [Ruminococcus sp.]|nr:Crp/Fnr family transcriptional regulator [Ruminococcus sp.]
MSREAIYHSHSSTEMNEEMQQLFEKITITRTFSKGEIIYRQGDYAKTFCYLKKGRVSVFMTSIDGMEKTLNTACKGELLGEGAFFDKKPRVSSARAVTACEVVMIDEDMLMQMFTKHPRLAFQLLEILANRIRLLSSQLDSMTFLQADARIASLLLQNEKNSIVSLTHEEIATAVGVSRVTVSKTLSRFAKKGYITTEYRKITIKDRQVLQNF